MSDYTYFDADGNSFSKYHKAALYMLTQRGFSASKSLKNRYKGSSGSGSSWFDTVVLGLEFLLSRGQRPELPTWEMYSFEGQEMKEMGDYPGSKSKEKLHFTTMQRARHTMQTLFVEGMDVKKGKNVIKE